MPFPSDWDLRPRQGAGTLRFGMTYDDVVSLLGEPDQQLSGPWRSQTKRAGWREGALAVHFRPAVVFIEVSRGAGLSAWLEGVNIFGTPAEDVVSALVARGHVFDVHKPEPSHTYVFKELDFALWRQSIPTGEDDDDGRLFDTASVGEKGYYT